MSSATSPGVDLPEPARSACHGTVRRPSPYREGVRTAVVPGTFDPVTLGHVDIVVRAARLFDEVVVGIARNAGKTPLLDAETRRAAFAGAVAHLPGVRVEIVPGLLVDFCREVGAVAIVKGLRGGGDLDAEAPMAAMNRHLSAVGTGDAGVDTVFLVSDGRLAHIASSMVRDVATYDGPIDDLVPDGVGDLVRAAIADRSARSRTGRDSSGPAPSVPSAPTPRETP
ncbi:phosphopantetheine adenylyltransferase [Salana multivorans]|uniref:Phosphopantetheine adenylyltransferase n=1 Tax=Salana multivorans TaxID=120377 RepID=A0A3N2D032_9MICO|nr:phosphopantetheine adenylyltransferase [Salana multivorans]